jgi:hypothetical protein
LNINGISIVEKNVREAEDNIKSTKDSSVKVAFSHFFIPQGTQIVMLKDVPQMPENGLLPFIALIECMLSGTVKLLVCQQWMLDILDVLIKDAFYKGSFYPFLVLQDNSKKRKNQKGDDESEGDKSNGDGGDDDADAGDDDDAAAAGDDDDDDDDGDYNESVPKRKKHGGGFSKQTKGCFVEEAEVSKISLTDTSSDARQTE